MGMKTAPAEALPTVIAYSNSNFLRMVETSGKLGSDGLGNLKHSSTILAFHLNNIGCDNVCVRSTAKRTIDRFSFAFHGSSCFNNVSAKSDFSELKTHAYTDPCSNRRIKIESSSTSF
jgi:hypothetical protein